MPTTNVLNKLQNWKLKKWDWMRSLWSGQSITPLTDGAKSDTPTLKGLHKSNIVSQLKDLMLSDFIKCIVDKDLSVLGDAPIDELEFAWFDIISDYYELRKDKRAVHTANLVKQIEVLKLRKQRLTMLIEAITAQYHDVIAKCLRNEYPRLKFTKESYENDVVLSGNMERNNDAKLTILKSELESIQKDGEKNKGKKATRTDFIEYLIEINKHEHSSYTEKTLSVEMFALCLNRLEAHIEYLKRAK